jgi:hypothetical protein
VNLAQRKAKPARTPVPVLFEPPLPFQFIATARDWNGAQFGAPGQSSGRPWQPVRVSQRCCNASCFFGPRQQWVNSRRRPA